MFTPEPLLGFLVIIVLPTIILFLTKIKGLSSYIFTILSISIISGCVQLLLNVDPNHIKWFLEFSIYFLALFIIISRKKVVFPRFSLLIFFLFVVVISYVINEQLRPIQLLLFLRKYLFIFIIYFIFENIIISNKNIKHFISFLSIIFVSQIFVNIIRFIIIGQSEEYIGTLAVRGGSLTVTFALVGISFAFATYLFTKQRRYILAFLGFFIFAIIGEKRAIIAFVPLLLLFQTYFFSKKNKTFSPERFIKRVLLISSLVVLIIYFSVRLNPTLNPENQVMGSFDYEFLLDYSDKYLNPGSKKLGAQYYGRGEAPLAVYNLLLQKDNLIKFLFGLGPGDIIMSRYNTGGNFNRLEDIIAFKYDIGYGARTGLLFTALQVGFLGVSLFLYFIISILLELRRKFLNKNNLNLQYYIILLGLIGAFFVFIMDFLLYSRTMYENVTLVMTLFLVKNFIKNEEYFLKRFI